MTDKEPLKNMSKKMSTSKKIMLISMLMCLTPFLMMRPAYWIFDHFNIPRRYMAHVEYLYGVIFIVFGVICICTFLFRFLKYYYNLNYLEIWRNTSKGIFLFFIISLLFIILAPLAWQAICKYTIGRCISNSCGYFGMIATILTLLINILFLSFYLYSNIYRIYMEILVVTGIISILANIAIPNFYLSASSIKHCEAIANLHAIYKAEKEFYTKNGEYSASFENLNWAPKDRDKFCYQISDSAIVKPTVKYDKNDCTLPPDIKPFVSKDRFLIVAVGNIDNDTTLDVWSINEKKELKNLVDDVRN